MANEVEHKFNHLQHVRVIDDSSPFFGKVGEIGVRFSTTNPELEWELNVPMYVVYFDQEKSRGFFYEWQLREL